MVLIESTLLLKSVPMAMFVASRGLGPYLRQHFFDKTFQGLYQVNAFDLALLIPYFIVLIILAAYGGHRYWLVYLYYKHKKNETTDPAGAFRRTAARHRPVADFQRAIRRRAVARRRLPARIPARKTGYPVTGRLHRRDRRSGPQLGRALCRAGESGYLSSPQQSPGLQGRCAAKGLKTCEGRVCRDL